MNLVELHRQVMRELETFDVEAIMPELTNVAEGSLKDVLDRQNSLYYQYLTCLTRLQQPTQVVELGGAMGTSALCMLPEMPSASKLYSITLEEHGLEFSFIKKDYPQLVKVIGDDLDLNSWPKDLDFSKTDILFIDALHTKEQLEAELALYLPLIGKGKLIILDDIKFDRGMWEAWLNIQNPKLDVSVLHHSGFGFLLS